MWKLGILGLEFLISRQRCFFYQFLFLGRVHSFAWIVTYGCRCRDFIHRFGRYAPPGARGSATSVSRAAYLHRSILPMFLPLVYLGILEHHSKRYILVYQVKVQGVFFSLGLPPKVPSTEKLS